MFRNKSHLLTYGRYILLVNDKGHFILVRRSNFHLQEDRFIDRKLLQCLCFLYSVLDYWVLLASSVLIQIKFYWPHQYLLFLSENKK